MLRAAVEIAGRAVRDAECRQQGQAGFGDECGHPAFAGAVSQGDHELQLGEQLDEPGEPEQRADDMWRVALAVRSPSGWYQGTTFQATSRSRGRLAWSRKRKKLAAVSSLLSAEMNPEPRDAVAIRPGFSSRNRTGALVPPPSGLNQGA